MRRLLASMVALALITALLPSAVLAAAPANDNLADAVLLTGTSGSVTGDTTEATVETSEYFYGYHSVWYKWSNPGRKDVAAIFTTCDGATYDTILDVVSADTTAPDFTTLTAVAWNDDACGSLQSRVGFIAEPGMTYWIRLSGYQAWSAGSYTLGWSTSAVISGTLSLTLTNTPKDPLTCTLTVKSVNLLADQAYTLVKGEAQFGLTTFGGRYTGTAVLDKAAWSAGAPGELTVDPSTVVSADGASVVTPKIVNRCK